MFFAGILGLSFVLYCEIAHLLASARAVGVSAITVDYSVANRVHRHALLIVILQGT
jgi:hypothetical protein